jgi:predicted small lipoprotein YifL
MRLDRRIVSLVLWFLVLAAAACGGDDKQPLPTPDAEVTGEVDEQDGRGEIDDDILPVDVEVVEDVEVIPDDVTDVDVPPEPELSFCVTATGGCLSEFPACLTMADDQYPAVAGLQVNINVDSAHIAQGTKVELWVDQVLVDSINKPADQFSFNQVTLSHKPEGHAIEVRVPNVINAQLSVCVETGDCGITLAPANDACLGVDADEETDGVQVEFTVTNDGTDCTEAWLEVDGAEVPAEHVTLTDGAAVIMVTLGAGAAELVCTEAEVTAHVTDPANPAREATLGPLAFLADNSLPVVTIEEPSAVSVNLLQDEDLEADGIQVTVSGTLEQVASQDVVELLVDGELVDAATAGTGEFSFVATLATAGPHDIDPGDRLLRQPG